MSNRASAYSIPPAGKVSALHQRMIDDMTVRTLAPDTMLCYRKQDHYSPDIFTGPQSSQARKTFENINSI